MKHSPALAASLAPLCLCLAALGIAAAVPPSALAHRHRLVGLAAKSLLMQASVLYHESAPGRALDHGLAQQNVAELTRLTGSQLENLAALAQDPANASSVSEVTQMTSLATAAHALADSAAAALASGEAGQLGAHRDAQRIFSLEQQLLKLHQAAEAKLGIQPPPDPPPLEPGH